MPVSEGDNQVQAERNRVLEHLAREAQCVVHGKRSKKLTPDERQLAFEDLEGASAEVEGAASIGGDRRDLDGVVPPKRRQGRCPPCGGRGVPRAGPPPGQGTAEARGILLRRRVEHTVQSRLTPARQCLSLTQGWRSACLALV